MDEETKLKQNRFYEFCRNSKKYGDMRRKMSMAEAKAKELEEAADGKTGAEADALLAESSKYAREALVARLEAAKLDALITQFQIEEHDAASEELAEAK